MRTDLRGLVVAVLLCALAPFASAAEKIYRLVGGVPTEIGQRDVAHRYRMFTGPDGAPAYLELTTAEETARTTEEALPPPPFAGLGRFVAQRAGQPFATNTPNAIDYTSELRDNASFHDTAVNPDRVVIPAAQAGVYDVTVGVRFNESTAAGGCTANAGDRLVQIRVSGTPVATMRVRAPAAGDTELVLPAGDQDLSVGDIVRVFAVQTCGGTMTVDSRIAVRRISE